MQPDLLKDLPKDLPNLTAAVYYQVQGCDDFVEGMQFGSACRKVPKSVDTVNFSATHTEWGPLQQPPSVTVNAPKRVHKKGIVKPAPTGAGTTTATTSSAPDKSIPVQIAEQLTRHGVTYAAQAKGAAIGFKIGLAGGPAGAYGGALIGSWIGCGTTKYGFAYYDYAQKERWDLHPEHSLGNVIYVVKMCSPAGFIFRAIEAKEPHEKGLALLGGLTYFTDPIVSVLGQLAPAAPSVINNFKLIASGFNSKPDGGMVKPRKQRRQAQARVAATQ